MKKAILYSLIMCSYLYSSTDKEIFMDKYINEEQFNKTQEESKQYRDRLSSDVNLKDMSKSTMKESDSKLQENSNNEKAFIIANTISDDTKSVDFQNKVTGYKENILKDKALDFDGKMGDYKKQITNEKEVKYKNKVLKNNERLLIAISSSMPDEVIKNYFKSFGDINDDVLFVMNGFIGNDPKKIMPTLQYISGLLDKNNGASKESGDSKYIFRVDINPKIFAKYNLSEVPAVIFVKNYNPFSEIQGNAVETESNEEVFISYGDSRINYVLEKINKEAKSEGLENLIKEINKGFFNE